MEQINSNEDACVFILNTITKFVPDHVCTRATCPQIAQVISYFINKGYELSEEVLNSYIKYFADKNKRQYYRRNTSECISYFNNEIVNILLTNYNLSIESFKNAVALDKVSMIENVINLNGYVWDGLLLYIFNDGTPKIWQSVIYKLIQTTDITIDILERCIEHGLTDCVSYLLNEKNMATGELLDTLMKNAIESGCIDIVEIIGEKCQLNYDHLLHACKHSDGAAIKYIIENKIIPTYECLEEYIDAVGISGRRYGKYVAEPLSKTGIETIANLIINYGVVPDKNIMLKMARKHAMIHNVEKFNIEFDQDYNTFCIETNTNPYNKKLPYTIDNLATVCRKGPISAVRKIISQQIVPNEKCLEEAVLSKSNLPTIRELITKHKVKVSLDALVNCANMQGRSQTEFIIKSYVEQERNKTRNIPDKQPEQIKEEVKINNSDDDDLNDDDLNKEKIIVDLKEKAVMNPQTNKKFNNSEKKVISAYEATLFGTKRIGTKRIATSYGKYKQLLAIYIMKNGVLKDNLLHIDSALAKLSNIDKDSYVSGDDIEIFYSICFASQP